MKTIKKEKTLEVSNCCFAPVIVGGDNSQLGGTNYYVCTDCNSPCDIMVLHVLAKKTDQDIKIARRILTEYRKHKGMSGNQWAMIAAIKVKSLIH